MSEIAIKGINKSFGTNHVIRDLSLAVESGELISVVGPSGCGKTTLMKLIAGLEAPDSGDVLLGGISGRGIPANKRDAVIVFQDYGLFPHMTVAGNVEFGLVARGIDKKRRAVLAAEVLRRMGVGEKAGAYPHQLSGGQKQRVALARACVLKPKVLLLDEPFSALDTNLKDSMREFVFDLQKELGITTILVTHDRREAFMFSGRMAVLFEGRIAQFAPPEEIYRRPASRSIAEFCGEANYLAGEFDSGLFRCALGEFRLPAAGEGATTEGATTLMLRNDQIEFAADGVPCRIRQKRFQGYATTYAVEVAGAAGETIVLKLDCQGPGHESGENARIRACAGAGWIVADK